MKWLVPLLLLTASTWAQPLQVQTSQNADPALQPLTTQAAGHRLGRHAGGVAALSHAETAGARRLVAGARSADHPGR